MDKPCKCESGIFLTIWDISSSIYILFLGLAQSLGSSFFFREKSRGSWQFTNPITEIKLLHCGI